MTQPIAKQHLKTVRGRSEHARKATLDRLAKLKAKHVAHVSAVGERRTAPPGKALGLVGRAKSEKALG